MSNPIRLPTVEIPKDYESPFHGVLIDDAIAAEIVRRALAHDETVRAGIKGLIQRLEDNTKPPGHDSPVDHVKDLMARLEQAESERDAEKELASNLAADLESARNDFIAANKDFAEAIRQRNAERVEVERQKQINARASDAGRCIIAERDAARAEADALRAEVAALKARKVNLPHPRIGWDKSRTAETVLDWQQTIAAIRAAGVEVES